MQLRELIKVIREEKDWTQVQMAAVLKINQQDVQGMENAGRNLEKQFSIFLKLLKICRDLKIDPAQQLPHNVESKHEEGRHAVNEDPAERIIKVIKDAIDTRKGGTPSGDTAPGKPRKSK